MSKVYLVQSEGGVEAVKTSRVKAEAAARALEARSRAFLNNGNCYDFWVEEQSIS